jgi:hypothetical protein
VGAGKKRGLIMVRSLTELRRTWPVKIAGPILVVLFVWLVIVTVAVLINAFPDSNGVLRNFY